MINQQQGTIRIGTSGIAIPGAKNTFPREFQDNTRLHYYGSLFNTLEVNSSFYKIPLPTTFMKWKKEVPDNFTFTVKLWRGITHKEDLNYKTDDLQVFMRSAKHLRNKSGCLLIQFPSSITFHYKSKVEEIFQAITNIESSATWKIAIELRHPSWYQQDAYSLFEKYNVSMVYHDMPRSKTPLDYLAQQFAYFRFHGPTGNYKGNYSNAFIEEYAARIQSFQAQGKDVYVYFNNTLGEAFQNAQLMQQLVTKNNV